MRVAYTLEQCWHRVPGGTAVAALEVARALRRRGDVELVPVAGRHRSAPPPPWDPGLPVARLALAAPWLYETWLRWGWPEVERASGPVDVAHATTIIPSASSAPLVVTIHDLAFVHEPEHFTSHGVRVFMRSLHRIRDEAALVLCSSASTAADCRTAGIDAPRLRVVPLGVDAAPATADAVTRVRAERGLPARFALFVGTIEPRKNLGNLVAAMARLDEPLPLVVAGAAGWGDSGVAAGADVALPRLRARRRPARAVRRGGRVLLPEPPRGLRAAGARGDGAGHAGGDERRDLHGGGRRRCRRAGRPPRPGRHRPTGSAPRSGVPASWARSAGRVRPRETWDLAAELTAAAYREAVAAS